MTAVAADGRAPSDVAAARSHASRRLAGAGCETPGLDADLLLAEALGTGRAALLADPGRRLDPAGAERFEWLLARREEREPVAYILGRRGFRRLELEVDRRVLVPRPETELLVEAALGLARGARVLDVGTGSGAVALALKHERPDLEVCASDASPAALDVARANASRLGLSVAFHRADLLGGLPGPFDAVVANLPYVADREMASLPAEISRHEPRLALAGGPEGLTQIGRLVAQARDVAFVALEVGAGQAQAVRALLAAQGREVRVLSDLAAIERVVVGDRA